MSPESTNSTARLMVQETYRLRRRHMTPYLAANEVVDMCARWVAADVDEGIVPTWTLTAYRLAVAIRDRANVLGGGEYDKPIEEYSPRELFWLRGVRQQQRQHAGVVAS